MTSRSEQKHSVTVKFSFGCPVLSLIWTVKIFHNTVTNLHLTVDAKIVWVQCGLHMFVAHFYFT